MKASSLSVSKVEFVHVKVESNPDFTGDFSDSLRQLDFDFAGVYFKRRTMFKYDRETSADPKSFIFGLNIRLSKEDGEEDSVELPYFIDVRTVAYLRYASDAKSGMDLFRAVRATGYAILYGAIREMVSNLTARSTHGLWTLPAANFDQAAHEEAVRDEERRQSYLADQAKPVKTVKRSRKPSTKNIE